jgi:hypothetical protein
MPELTIIGRVESSLSHPASAPKQGAEFTRAKAGPARD